MSVAKYRPDIDGLRAIAVLSVVLYHLGIGPLRGGFVGVDIFFVISGFLITGIVHKEITSGDFSFAGFYERRVRRIFPALFAMLLVVLAAAPFLLLPSDLKGLGAATLATLAFCSNLLFWRQSGYFDTTSQFSPLLHTWSLAVEEQFYIVFPVLLILVARFAPKRLTPILIGAGLLSFLLCVAQQPIRPSATFYLAPFRAWEFILGSLLAVGAVPAVRNPILRESASAAALVVLFGAIWWIEEGIHFPGWQAALPVVATTVLLHIGTNGTTLVHRALSSRPLALVGLISYSFYLWHWPAVVFLHYHQGMDSLTAIQAPMLLAAIIITAWLSYRWVETPFRRRRSGALIGSRRGLFVTATVASVALAILAIAVRADQGWQSRVSAEVVALDRARTPELPFSHCDGTLPGADPQCGAGDSRAATKALLWGDSHALAWSPAFDLLGQRNKVDVALAVSSACAPLLGVVNPANATCHAFNRDVMNYVRTTRPNQIYLVASWGAYSRPDGEYVLSDDQGRKGNANVFSPALQRTIEAIRPYTKRILLVGRVPGTVGDRHFGGDVPFKLALAEWTGGPRLPLKTIAAVQAESKWYRDAVAVYATDPQVALVNPVRWFCNSAFCRYDDDSGKLLYRDTNHLSLMGARFVAQHFPAELLSSPGRSGDEASDVRRRQDAPPQE